MNANFYHNNLLSYLAKIILFIKYKSKFNKIVFFFLSIQSYCYWLTNYILKEFKLNN